MAFENYMDKLKRLFYPAGFLCPMSGFGIVPGGISGLTGILPAPFIHADIANSLSLLLPGFIFVLTDTDGYGSDTD